MGVPLKRAWRICRQLDAEYERLDTAAAMFRAESRPRARRKSVPANGARRSVPVGGKPRFPSPPIP